MDRRTGGQDRRTRHEIRRTGDRRTEGREEDVWQVGDMWREGRRPKSVLNVILFAINHKPYYTALHGTVLHYTANTHTHLDTWTPDLFTALHFTA